MTNGLVHRYDTLTITSYLLLLKKQVTPRCHAEIIAFIELVNFVPIGQTSLAMTNHHDCQNYLTFILGFKGKNRYRSWVGHETPSHH